MPTRIYAHIALFTVSLIYGLTFVIAKEVMPAYLSAFGFIFWRIGIACLGFWIIGSFLNREKVHQKDLTRLFFCGVFGAAINMLLFFKGLTLTKPINASILMMGTPIMVFILASIFLKEKVYISKLIGVLLGIAGSSVILLFNAQFKFAQETFLGDLFIFLNALSYGVYLILVRDLLKKYKGITVAKWVFLFGFLFVVPFTVKQGLSAEFSMIPYRIWIYIIYIILGSTLLTYFLNLYAVSKVGPTAVSVYIYAQPLIASIFAISLDKDVISVEKILGALLIFIGVYLVSKQVQFKT